jgi:hypothetical protein
MADKKIKTRLQQKHDTAANWALATNFIPLAGEMIVYDADETCDYARVKFGDGIVNADGVIVGTNVNDLPFATTFGGTTSEDDGKFLRIVNGVPKWTTVPVADDTLLF